MISYKEKYQQVVVNFTGNYSEKIVIHSDHCGADLQKTTGEKKIPFCVGKNVLLYTCVVPNLPVLLGTLSVPRSDC